MFILFPLWWIIPILTGLFIIGNWKNKDISQSEYDSWYKSQLQDPKSPISIHRLFRYIIDNFPSGDTKEKRIEYYNKNYVEKPKWKWWYLIPIVFSILMIIGIFGSMSRELHQLSETAQF